MDEWFRWIVGGLLGVIVTVFWAVANTLFNRQEELFRGKIDKDEADRRIRESQNELRKHVDGCENKSQMVANELKEQTRQIGEMTTALAVLARTIEERTPKQ